MTLTEFLLARVAEDEALISGALDVGVGFFGDQWAYFAWGYEIDVNYPRIAAECAAKRRIIELHTDDPTLPCPTCADPAGVYEHQPVWQPCPTLRLLALPYSDHRDYLEEWRP